MTTKKLIFTVLFAFLITGIWITSCKKDEVKTPSVNKSEQQLVFKEFWDIYDRHYPLFHRKNINWQTIFDTYNSQITESTTDLQLFQIFNTIMTTVIKDGHSDLEFNDSQAAVYDPQFNQEVIDMVENNTVNKVNIVSGSINNPYLSYGTLVSNPNIGYINSKNFEPINENESEFDNFKAIVDEALTALQYKEGIILDVRTNGGGQGPFAYYLAGRFFSVSSPVELVRQRIKTARGSTVSSLADWATEEFIGYPDSRVEGGYVAGVFPEDNAISLSGSFQYTDKVAVLTAKNTASAAEYFTAAMKTQAHVKTFGETTFGIFAGSDIFTLTSGNGKWKIRVSTHDIEIKYDGRFQSFEGIGIKPDEVLIPTQAQVTSGTDTHIDAAVSYIK